MIIIMHSHVTDEEVHTVEQKLQSLGLEANVSRGLERTIIGAIGDERKIHKKTLQALPGVQDVIRVLKPYKIVAREGHEADTVINIKGIPLGGQTIQVIGGPCSVETQEQMDAAAHGVAHAGCRLMRGGAFKPRTSPYSFQGKGVEGLQIFRQAADKFQLPIITELMDVRYLDDFLKYGVEVIQIGTRNMQNFDLLKEVGKTHTPVILKRGLCATISEWLMSAEYIAAGGNHNIILCERGVRSFEKAYRNMLDVTAIPVLKKETHLPVIVDPSHAAGKAWLVSTLSKAAIAAGADGLLVEMHPHPCDAWCDADQALTPDELKNLMGELQGIAQAVGRSL
ncbi:MAG: 3-deoxy-7-phosphoheptulonate synthase [Candidatus Parabeggiatoa sp. nov. 3]|nr:MAG: 3-deoxy-7-phosphoheptulonate synthase [Gammaproteobacteria bacterium]RKZ63239.1 MAG: 3-deoxy-7-phosphoheptulonate synthase [Gammaproteobacteria bacterium]RKZ84290.1 MAG: 3-deoxy-7-phosphoheptulonate synthase [Gammaproteobacteria bacterium]